MKLAKVYYVNWQDDRGMREAVRATLADGGRGHWLQEKGGQYGKVMAELYDFVCQLDVEDNEHAEGVYAMLNRDSVRHLNLMHDNRRLRSMSIGDVVNIGDYWYLCQVIGFFLLKQGDFTEALAQKLSVGAHR